MTKVLISLMVSTLILFTGCNNANPLGKTEATNSVYVFQQSATPLEVSIEPSVIMLGQTANITIKTTPGAFVSIGIAPPDPPPASGFRYNYYLPRNLTDLQSRHMADDKGIFTTSFSNRVGLEKDRGLLATIPGYYRVIATAEAVLVDEARYERYLILGMSKEDMAKQGVLSGSGNVTIVIASFLVR